MTSTNTKLASILSQFFDRTIKDEIKLKNLRWLEKHWVSSIYEDFWKAIITEPSDIVQQKSLEVLISVHKLKSYPRIFRYIENGSLSKLSTDFVAVRFFSVLKDYYLENLDLDDCSSIKFSLDILRKSYFRPNSQLIHFILCLVQELSLASRHSLDILYGSVGFQLIVFLRELFFGGKKKNAGDFLANHLVHLSQPTRLLLLFKIGFPAKTITMYLKRNSSHISASFVRSIISGTSFTFGCKMFLSALISSRQEEKMIYSKFYHELVSNLPIDGPINFRLNEVEENEKFADLFLHYYKLGQLNYFVWFYLDVLTNSSSNFKNSFKYLKSKSLSIEDFSNWKLEPATGLLDWLPWNFLVEYPLLVEILEKNKFYSKLKQLITENIDHSTTSNVIDSLSTVEVIDKIKLLVKELIDQTNGQKILRFLDREREYLIKTGDKSWLIGFFAPFLHFDIQTLELMENVGAFFLLSERNLTPFKLLESYIMNQVNDVNNLDHILAKAILKERQHSILFFMSILPVVTFLQKKGGLSLLVSRFFPMKYWILLHPELTLLIISRLLDGYSSKMSDVALALLETCLINIVTYLDSADFDGKEQFIIRLRPLKEQLLKLRENQIFDTCSFIFFEFLGYFQVRYFGPFSLEKRQFKLLIRLLSRRLLAGDSSILGLSCKLIGINSVYINETVRILMEEQKKCDKKYPREFIDKLESFSIFSSKQQLFSYIKINDKSKPV